MKPEDAPSQTASARITIAAETVSVQASCTYQTALALMNALSRQDGTSLDAVAEGVLAGEVRFDRT